MGCRHSRSVMISDPLFFNEDGGIGVGGAGAGGAGGDSTSSAPTSRAATHHSPQLVIRTQHHHHHHHQPLPFSTTNTTTTTTTTSAAATVSSTTSSSLPTTSTRNLRRRRRSYYEAQLREEARTAEIVALQQSLAAMEDFFQSLLGQSHLFHEAMMDPSGGGAWNNPNAAGSGPPPASQEFLTKSLPALVVPCKGGTLCGVCGEEITLAGGDDGTAGAGRAIKLPCGHVFHQISCIQPWLERHCTCPVCRYEAPTDDASYETGRLERMSMRQLPADDDDDETTIAKATVTTTTTAEQEEDAKQEEEKTEVAAVTPSTRHANEDDDDDDYDEEEQDDDILDDSIPSFATMNNFTTTDVYDADESGTEEASVKPSSSGTYFPKAPHRNNGASHYDADESSLEETVDFGAAAGGLRTPLSSLAAAAAGNFSTDDST